MGHLMKKIIYEIRPKARHNGYELTGGTLKYAMWFMVKDHAYTYGQREARGSECEFVEIDREAVKAA